jgi:hypothetical protein
MLSAALLRRIACCGACYTVAGCASRCGENSGDSKFTPHDVKAYVRMLCDGDLDSLFTCDVCPKAFCAGRPLFQCPLLPGGG